MILIVEEETNFKRIENLLDKTDTSVLYANSGKEAVDLCRKNPDIKLILMNLNIPVIDGFETAKQIRKSRDDIYVIDQTTNYYSKKMVNAFKSGFNEILLMPVENKVLVERLASYLSLS